MNRSKILLLAISIIAVQCLDKLGYSSCELCMQTYKVNCTICYNRCNDNKNLLNCTSYQCSQTDASGNCISYTNTTLNNNTCLNACCNTFTTATIFNESNFNLCIQRDASTPNNINIGLTLGLVLSLLVLLFFIGLAFLLALTLCGSEKQDQKSKDQNLVVQKQYVPSSQGFYPFNMKDTGTQRVQQQQQLWHLSNMITGTCRICGQRQMNIIGGCGHQYHYGCLCSRYINLYTCPLCQVPNSLLNTKVYCSNCFSSYRFLDIQNEPLNINYSNFYQNIKCNRCT